MGAPETCDISSKKIQYGVWVPYHVILCHLLNVSDGRIESHSDTQRQMYTNYLSRQWSPFSHFYIFHIFISHLANSCILVFSDKTIVIFLRPNNSYNRTCTFPAIGYPYPAMFLYVNWFALSV